MSGIGGHVNRGDRRRRLEPPPMTIGDVLPVVERLARFEREFMRRYDAAWREFVARQPTSTGNYWGRGA
jgi:hypothetical protein